MQGLARLSVNRPVFAAVLILALTIVGLFAIPKLGVDRYPKVDFPYITVTTVMPGATPEEMETEVTEEIEKQVNTVSGIDTLQSTSAEGVSVVTIGFVLEKDADVAAEEVRAKVDAALPELPDEAEKPTVSKMDSTSGAIISFTLTSPDASIRTLTEYADKQLRPQVESLSGVGEVKIVGGRSRQINVEVDPYRLRSFNLTATDVKRALQTQNLQIPGGALDQGERRLSVRTQGRVSTVADLENVVVRVRQGQPILIKDVAEVEDSEEEAESIANVDGVTAVLLQVKKQSGANTVAVIESVKEKLHQIASSLPKGYETRVVSDQSIFIKAALHSVEEHLILGSLLASVVVLVFLWNWRTTLISALAIPTSIISTFALMSMMGFTLNVITLLALTLAVGIVIDDAIIVLENIYRFLEEKEMTPFQAAIEATKEIGLAVLATTMSLVAVFLPVAFMTGIVGRFLNSFGLTMAFAIMVSLLVAFTLTPMLSARWLKSPKKALADVLNGAGLRGTTNDEGQTTNVKGHSIVERTLNAFFGWLEGVYGGLLWWSLKHRWVVVTISVAVLFSTVPLGKRVNKNFLPNDDESQYTVSVRAPEGTSLAATESLLNRIAADIRQLPEVKYTVVTIGDDTQKTQNLGSILVQMNKVEERKTGIDQFTLMNKTRTDVLSKYPRELRTSVSPPNAFGNGAQADIQYAITGPDLDTLTRAANAVLAELRDAPGVADADTNSIIGKPELGVTVDRSMAAELGVSIADVATGLRVLVAGEKVTEFSDEGQQYDIFLRALPSYRDQQESLSLFTVPTSKSGIDAVPMEQVVSFAEGSGPSVVNRLARQRQVTISANLLPGASQQAVQDKVAELVKKQNLGPEYKGEFLGASRELVKSFKSFMLAFLLSFVFMYLILAAQFESWLHPVTILISLPLTVPFALLSLLLLGESLNIFSMLGILVLFGVVKKNAILQVDHANHLRGEGLEREEALVQASRDRLRPILMTTIAFVAGMIPLAISTGTGAGTNRASGGVIIGGQTLALVLTLVATPVFYSLFDDLSLAFGRAKARLFKTQPAPMVTAQPMLNERGG
jgi:hydrophobic/amphiphilic exporter-1 (mainly G- bacteria), HAE1 family